MSEEMNEQKDIFEEKTDEGAAKDSAFAAQENHAMYQQVERGTVINGAPLKPASIGYGITAMVLGILSLLCFCMCCINIPLGIAAIIFAIVQLVLGSKELSSGITPSKAAKGMAIAGIVTALTSFGLMIWMYFGIAGNEDLYEAITKGNESPAYYEQFFDDLYGEGNPYSELFNQINEQINEL